jgi:sporulation protein YlmC with PRC-barrel domain
MKIRSRNITPWMAALLCLTLAPGTKATDEADAPKASTSQETSSETKSNEGAPAKFNKASGIVGMDVRNQKGEHLGHIKDLVIDWKTEQVSYAVISTGDRLLLDIKEKLLAVPLTALTVSLDQKHLILNADKAKVEAALGFNRNNWPSVSNTSWGAEPFWQKGTETPAVTNEPAKDPNANEKPLMVPPPIPEMKPHMKPDQDNESKPDMDPEQNPDTVPESHQDTNPDEATGV